jgi:molybdopterin molybdotransferase
MAGGAGPRDLISLDEAVCRLSRWPMVLQSDLASLRDAAFRVLAEDVTSPISLPPFDNSAMDGYAYRCADVPPDRRIEIVDRAAAGHIAQRAQLPIGTAARIFTGAVMPGGADTVALQEHCRVEGGFVIVPEGLPAGANRRLAGEDVEKGRVVLTSGIRLRPQDIAMAAAIGRSALIVRRKVRVAIFTTGDELSPPGIPLPPGHIYDSNRYAILAALQGLGADISDLGILPDNMGAIRTALDVAASGHDLIISTGGVSVGEEDHVKAAVAEFGAVDFWQLAIKPGKPVAVGDVGGVPFIGLPGNPVSALITFWLIARPLLLRLQGITDGAIRRIPVSAGFVKHRRPGRREFLRVRLRAVEGLLVAEIFPSAGSGDGMVGWSRRHRRGAGRHRAG